MARARSVLRAAAGAGVAGAIALTTLTSHIAVAEGINFRSFSASAAIGPPAEAFAAKLQNATKTALGTAGTVHFVKLAGTPAIPKQFSGDIVAAVAAGQSGGGFDAAYTSGSELNKTWGFIYNSGVPFGPTFDEFIGFFYGKSVDNGQKTGQDLVQESLDLRGRGIVAIPIVGSPEQLSGYFAEPMDNVPGRKGIGLAGLCERPWVLRYLPPGENVISLACDDLVATHKIPRKNLSFIQAVPGGGSLVDAVLAKTLDGFEFATPLDDVSQLFNTATNPGIARVRYVHTPGWQQQFLITWMIINKSVWSALSPAQQIMIHTVAREHVISSYAENLRQQGAALQLIMDANKNDNNPDNDLVMVKWPQRDQIRLRDATIRFLNARADDQSLPVNDRADYVKILDALRLYVRTNNHYWDNRQVSTSLRFEDWSARVGDCWKQKCEPPRVDARRRP
jgi:TRAP-type mannitol/chloroaromatic compound transport system substrate-binding protein